MSEAAVTILGIRHHGPGSARSVLRALDEIKPDCVLIEGPPDADDVIALAALESMRPPVAILVHEADNPASAVYYPFAEFSPEWQAMRWALAHGVAVRFMDLPQWHRLAIQAERWEKIKAEYEKAAATPAPEADASEDDSEQVAIESPAMFEPDPLQQLARAAGFDDGERWWEHVVEHQREQGTEIFAAIRDAMAELRKEPNRRSSLDLDEPLREAWMRKTIREARKGGAQRIAVVCGAWHAPVLDVDATPKKQDDDLLKGLPKRKTAATWIPWTHDRLAYASGYGAGVQSPGWYEHLWNRQTHVLDAWMTRVAHLLREKDIDCSSAHVIEAVRLAEALATMRGRPLADLSDIADATRSIFCFDSDLAMRLISRELLVGVRMGEVPDDTPMVPLQQDLLRLQKRLRLKPEALEKQIDLDLRNDTDRERSTLLHRLRLLQIDWGTPLQQGGGKGTFHELWQLRWEPAFAVRLIESGTLGTTIETAAGAALAKLAGETSDLPSLASRLQDALLASLGDAAAALVKQIEGVAALSSDITLLMQTLPPLVSLIRYGNVRNTDEAMVREIVNGIVPRISVGLGAAVASLNDEAAAAMEGRIRTTNDALQQLADDTHTKDWLDALARLLEFDTVHGLIRGLAARLLLDAGRIDTGEVARRLSLTLSRGNDPAAGARWLEGFLKGSGLLLIHDAKLLGLIDAWVSEIGTETFDELLPLLRRTFSTFPPPERKQIGQMLTKGRGLESRDDTPDQTINHERAARALPLLRQILGGAS